MTDDMFLLFSLEPPSKKKRNVTGSDFGLVSVKNKEQHSGKLPCQEAASKYNSYVILDIKSAQFIFLNNDSFLKNITKANGIVCQDYTLQLHTHRVWLLN